MTDRLISTINEARYVLAHIRTVRAAQLSEALLVCAREWAKVGGSLPAFEPERASPPYDERVGAGTPGGQAADGPLGDGTVGGANPPHHPRSDNDENKKVVKDNDENKKVVEDNDEKVNAWVDESDSVNTDIDKIIEEREKRNQYEKEKQAARKKVVEDERKAEQDKAFDVKPRRR